VRPPISPQTVSGHGRVDIFIVDCQQRVTDQCPYIVAIVELDEQIGLCLTSNLLDCGVDDVAIGIRVTVGFVARHDVLLSGTHLVDVGNQMTGTWFEQAASISAGTRRSWVDVALP